MPVIEKEADRDVPARAAHLGERASDRGAVRHRAQIPGADRLLNGRSEGPVAGERRQIEGVDAAAGLDDEGQAGRVALAGAQVHQRVRTHRGQRLAQCLDRRRFEESRLPLEHAERTEAGVAGYRGSSRPPSGGASGG
ncbi:hypothetical protein BJ973_000533 [Actinoplanes tereljensis]|nr:hypothetical protein [Actinoplanes tereljensis]